MILALWVLALVVTGAIWIAGAVDAMRPDGNCRTAGECLIVGFGKAAQLFFSTIPFGVTIAGFSIWMGWV